MTESNAHFLSTDQPGNPSAANESAQDIAIVTGAEFVAKDLGMKVEQTVVEQLGVARKVSISSTSTTMIADTASKDEIEMRVAQLKKELAETDSVYDTEKLSERIAKLSGGVAVIKVGGFLFCLCWWSRWLESEAGREVRGEQNRQELMERQPAAHLT